VSKVHAHGKCLRCHYIFGWDPPPRLSDAYCPTCGFPLALTSRQSELPFVEDRPPVGPRHTTNGKILAQSGVPIRL